MKTKYLLLVLHIVCCVLNLPFIFHGTSSTQVVCSSISSMCWAGCVVLDILGIRRESKKQNDTEAENEV